MRAFTKQNISATARIALAAGCLLGALSMSSKAVIIDLTVSLDATGTINGAIYSVDNSQPAGTGIFGKDDGGVFLQILETGPANSRDLMEEGYNTDAINVMDNGASPVFNHSILFSDLNQVTIDGILYVPFLLDANEPNSSPERLLSLDKLQIFSATSGSLSHATLGALAGDPATTLLYDMDGAPDGDSSVLLDYDLVGKGSGAADMGLFVPLTNFIGVNPDDNIILYSKFTGVDSGFEEWTLGAGTKPDDPQGPGIPEPHTNLLISLGLWLVLRHRRN